MNPTRRNYSMMALLKTVCAAALLLALPVAVQAQFSFITNNGAITITGYTGPGGDVVIPSETNGLPVTTIGASAFANKSTLTNVTIPGSVTNIADGAFDTCINLKVVSLTNGLVRIGAFSFSSCYSLTDITLPSTLGTISQYAFSYFLPLTNVFIPASVTNIGDRAFYRCHSLTAINVDPLNTAYSSADGVLFNQTKTTLVEFPAGKAGNYTITNTVTSIGIGAFSDCYNLTGVTMPSGLTSIGAFAFSGDYSLTNAPIPASVTSIGTYVFAGCSALTDITIPAGVSSIGNYAFYGCNAPFNVDPLNTAYSSADGILFDKNKTTLIQCPRSKTGSYTIPGTVTAIGISGFDLCAGLTSIVVPASVTSIGNYGFANCNGLTAIYFLGNAPSLGAQVFDSTTTTIFFLSGTTGWGATFGGRPTALFNPQFQNGGSNFGVQTNHFGFDITGISNQVVVVEASTNFVNPVWIPLQTNTLTGSPLYFSDPQPTTSYPSRFFRLRVQ